jgi:WhiB family redox-sensing transcriptional regulator
MHQQEALMTRGADWRSLGACRHHDPDLFFPISSTGPAIDQVARAKAVCASCPVRSACLRFALETSQDFGVWGGTSEQERRNMRRRERRSRHRKRAASVA